MIVQTKIVQIIFNGLLKVLRKEEISLILFLLFQLLFHAWSAVICSIWQFNEINCDPLRFFNYLEDCHQPSFLRHFGAHYSFCYSQLENNKPVRWNLAVTSNISRAFKQQRTAIFRERSNFCFLPLSFVSTIKVIKCQETVIEQQQRWYHKYLTEYSNRKSHSQIQSEPEPEPVPIVYNNQVRVLKRGRVRLTKSATFEWPSYKR